MKLLVLTFIKEHQQAVMAMVQQAGVAVFSLTETSGIKQKDSQNISNNWFGGSQVAFDSTLLFSFTDEVSANKTLEASIQFNKTTAIDFPVRTFILSVERSNIE
jgi:hypothetical protein